MPRRRGAMSGLLILLLGAWGALVPFIGSYFDLVIGPDNAWDMTTGRFWLSLVPGVVAVIGGLMLMQAGNRASATLGAQLALAAGIWFVIGTPLSLIWNDTPWGGAPLGDANRQALELLLYYYGIGAAITALAGIALGRVSARHEGDAERLDTATEMETAERRRSGRFGLRRRREEPVEEPTRVEEPARTEEPVRGEDAAVSSKQR